MKKRTQVKRTCWLLNTLAGSVCGVVGIGVAGVDAGAVGVDGCGA